MLKHISVGATPLLLILFGLAQGWVGVAQDKQNSGTSQSLVADKQYLKHLGLFNEPLIFPTNDVNAEIYRLTITPTFDNPIAVRIQRNSGGYMLIAKRLSGQGGYDAGTIKREKKRRLSEKEWKLLLSMLEQVNFWAIPSEEEKYKPDAEGTVEICLDGSDWFLEGVRGGKYHFVNRYCPDSKPFEAIGLRLVKLSKLGVKTSALY